MKTAVYRQIVVSIAKRHLVSLTRQFDPHTPVDEGGLVKLMAWQCGHRPATHVQHYTLEREFPAQLQPALIDRYLENSRIWHEFNLIRVGDIVNTPYVDTSNPSTPQTQRASSYNNEACDSKEEDKHQYDTNDDKDESEEEEKEEEEKEKKEQENEENEEEDEDEEEASQHTKEEGSRNNTVDSNTIVVQLPIPTDLKSLKCRKVDRSGISSPPDVDTDRDTIEWAVTSKSETEDAERAYDPPSSPTLPQTRKRKYSDDLDPSPMSKRIRQMEQELTALKRIRLQRIQLRKKPTFKVVVPLRRG